MDLAHLFRRDAARRRCQDGRVNVEVGGWGVLLCNKPLGTQLSVHMHPLIDFRPGLHQTDPEKVMHCYSNQ